MATIKCLSSKSSYPTWLTVSGQITDDMDQLRQKRWFTWMLNRDPLTEYQIEYYERFQQMIAAPDYDVTRILMKSQIRQNYNVNKFKSS